MGVRPNLVQAGKAGDPVLHQSEPLAGRPPARRGVDALAQERISIPPC